MRLNLNLGNLRASRRLLAAAAGLIVAAGAAAQTVDSVLTNRLFEPYGVVVDGNTYYVSDSANHRIVKYLPETGAFSILAGYTGQPGSADGRGVFARFSSPSGLILAPGRNGLVVADSANHTLRLITSAGEVTTLAGAPGVPGFNDGPVPASSARFHFPSGLAIDEAGNIYIADSKNNAIRMLDVNNVVSTLVPHLPNEFFEPAGVALGENGSLIVADTRNHSIKAIHPNGTVSLLAGRNSRLESGSMDSIFARDAFFNTPTAVLWLGGSHGYLISDTGNHALRRLYYNGDVAGYSVETYAGTPGQPGYVDEALLKAKFNSPVSMAKDPSGGFLIVDLRNHALRRIQSSAPLPPVRDPQIGWVDFVKDDFGELISKLVPVGQAIFNNDVTIAVLAEPGTETYFTYGPTPPSTLEDTIPAPNRLNGNTPPGYEDGLRPAEVPPSMLGPFPDVTIKAIGIQDGRRPSQVVQARFQFKVANPIVLGDNAASFSITNVTADAQMWYTLDGSDPTNNPATSIGPVMSGEKLTLPRSSEDVVFKVRAFRTNYRPSEIVTKVFSPEDFTANQMTFGFEGGEASSEFRGSAGQTFYAPVTLSVLPGQRIYSLQFNVTVTNLAGAAVTPGAVGFDTMLVKPLPGTDPPVYVPIEPAMFTKFDVAIFTNFLDNSSLVVTNWTPMFTNLLVTNFSANLLGVGWVERYGSTNLYDTIKQDLITYSQAHDNTFLSKNGKVVLGGYSFSIPTQASLGSVYQIEIDRPSATEDGVGADIFIEAPRDGSLRGGTVNATKHVEVVPGGIAPGQLHYTVGDAAPFRWFNAGDFGDTNLLNNDVLQVFQSAVYGLNTPPPNSDLFDAMDSSNGSVNNLLASDGNDTVINSIALGDGQLNVDDVFVTFRRSLDPGLKWYARFWSNGGRVAAEVPNRFRGSPAKTGSLLSSAPAGSPGEEIAGPPAAGFSIDPVQGAPGMTLEVPVRAVITGPHPLKTLLLRLRVVPLLGSPAIEEPVRFVADSRLGNPMFTHSMGVDDFAGAWVDRSVVGLRGETVLGILHVRIPESATAHAVYRVQFEHVSASPNGVALFPAQWHHGLVAAGDRLRSSWKDGISDAWRLIHFGSAALGMPMAGPAADPDQDGLSNWAEFLAGTDPSDFRSQFRLFVSEAGRGAAGMTIQWPSALGKRYVIEKSSALSPNGWSVVHGDVAGNGSLQQFTDPNPGNGVNFYRVRIAE